MRIVTLTLTLLLLAVSNICGSGVFPLDNPSKLIIGVNGTYTIQDDETLIELARKYDVGFNEITAANSNSDPWTPGKGNNIIIPASWLLPEILDDGLIINLAEMRLYYFFILDNRKYVATYPIGIGREGLNTPAGIFRITAKVKDPVWYVPDNIREENPGLPAFVPPGPDNPLGGYWLQLSLNGYGIHGTNRPYGIGRRVSHGCIRLYPEDIKTLFKFIRPGTMVKILSEPVKTGMHDNKVYIEIHRTGIEYPELMMLAVKNLSRKRLLKYVDTQLMIHAIKSATGLPAVISR